MLRLPNASREIPATEELFPNPYKGFTSFQHFRDEQLFSECATNEGWMKEHYPVYDFVPRKGREQGFYPDTEIVYIRMLWRDLEMEEGVYDFSKTDEIFRKAAEKKQSVMFRLMPHTTRQNEDVPDWLRNVIECPERSDAGRVKDSPRDPVYLEKFARAVEAFGLRYDGLAHFYAMDISLTGAWGEGHGMETYPEEVLRKLVDTYTRVFRNTHLLGQIIAPELVNYANESRPVGFRADGLGENYHMNVYFPKNIPAMHEVWKRAPVSFETYWYLGEWKKQGWDPDTIMERSLQWHISSLNAKSAPIPWEWKDKIHRWIKKMGYRFSIQKLEYPDKACAGDTLSLSVRIINSGVAPLYNRLPLTVLLKKEEREISVELPVDARNWMPGNTCETWLVPLPKNMESGNYTLWFRLGGGNLPTVKFASDTLRTESDFHYLADIAIERMML